MKNKKRKIGRNEMCHCESGLKYKNCCIEKDKQKGSDQIKPKMTVKSILDTLKFGLEHLNILTEDLRKVKVKEINIFNENSIECKIYPYNSNSIDIKMEMGTIMGFLYGFFKDDSFPDLLIPNYFAVRAYDENERELLYAISSKETAGLITKGNSIDWLKSTIFQENTLDYRLSIAKKQISEIENALRHVIADVLTTKHNNNWWNVSVGNKLSNSVKTDYRNQFDEECEDGTILIKYTYLVQLKKIICTNWKDFKHLFSSKIEFEKYLDELNLIRREEAHNREITEDHLEKLKTIYEFLLIQISTLYKQIIPEFLIDNWRMKIKKVMNKGYKPLFYGEELINEENQRKKLIKSTVSLLHLIAGIKKLEDDLNSIIIPIQKKEIHNEIVATLKNYRLLQEEMLDYAKNGQLQELEETAKKIEDYKKEMDSFLMKFLLSEG